MISYMLDTNIVSYALRGKPPEIQQRFESAAAHSLVVSAITAAELRYWAEKRPGQSRFTAQIEAFLERVPTLPWDATVAAVHGKLKARLFRLGRPLAELDMQIAAHALAGDCILVTHDAAFLQVPDLQTEDWVPFQR
jgi:tRNA(fMet)-specific endonuclease VapC